jgi:hypothetical protein
VNEKKKGFYFNREIQINAFLLFRLCRTQQILGEWQATLIRGLFGGGGFVIGRCSNVGKPHYATSKVS